MQQKITKEFLIKVVLIFFVLLCVGVVVGTKIYLSNRIRISPIERRPPTITPSSVSGNRVAVLGEDFLITMPSNPSTGYTWTADFDENYLMLRTKDFVADKTNSQTVGAGGTEIFTFVSIKAGETKIIMGYGRSWESKPSEKRIFKYNITGKTAVDPRCGQKITRNGSPVLCKGFQMSYEFDVNLGKCIGRETPACGFDIPFTSLEECQKICENNMIPINELKFKTINRGFNSNQAAQNNYVIKSEEEWISILQKTNAELPAPVDFDDEMILAVFQGEKPTGGYNIEIRKIVENENTIEVLVSETSPGSKCMVTDALTSPFHIIRIQKSDKEVLFRTEKVVTACE